METQQKLSEIGRSAYSTKETLQNSYDIAKYVIENGIKGDFVEFGVAAGSQIGAMAQALKDLKDTDRTIWGFDSFEGIPLSGSKDTVQPGIGEITHDVNVPEKDLLVTSGITVHSLKSVESNVKKWGFDLNRFKFVKGWFQDTVPQYLYAVPPISILRLDGDLYESTKWALKFEPKVVSGGVIIVDDWALVGCRRACDEFIDYSKYEGPKTIENSTPVYFVKK